MQACISWYTLYHQRSLVSLLLACIMSEKVRTGIAVKVEE